MSGAGGVRRLEAGARFTPRVGPDEALAQAWRDVERARAAAHAESVDAAFALAARVLSACGAHERVVALEGLRAALASADLATVRLARVHPVDLVVCEAEVARSGAAVRVVADPALSPGDVVVEARSGLLDGRLRARLDALRATLEPRA